VEVTVPADAIPEGNVTCLWSEEGGLARTAEGWKITIPA
jgi:hypothetical protein